jgi:hypothetical protein
VSKITVFFVKRAQIHRQCITGMDSEGFEISVLGIPYPFYEEEFPHHVEKYQGK